MTTIGLVGRGFIGEAFYEHMKDFYDVKVWDTDPSKCNVESLEELVHRTSYIFVSVPTPMNLKTGECDTSIVEDIISKINFIATTDKIVVIRSTVPPGTCKRLDKSPNGVSVVFNPEFLTEANHIQDFKTQDRVVLGGNALPCAHIAHLYSYAFPDAYIAMLDWTSAEMVKYTANTFLATKVTFANEIKQICDKLNISYDDMIRVVKMDSRLGTSHWSVPGPDGHLGFGGTCFPKDINALIAHAKKLKVKVPLLEAVWKKNLQLRPERDWELSKGRAVTP